VYPPIKTHLVSCGRLRLPLLAPQEERNSPPRFVQGQARMYALNQAHRNYPVPRRERKRPAPVKALERPIFYNYMRPVALSSMAYFRDCLTVLRHADVESVPLAPIPCARHSCLLKSRAVVKALGAYPVALWKSGGNAAAALSRSGPAPDNRRDRHRQKNWPAGPPTAFLSWPLELISSTPIYVTSLYPSYG
jgi:hypothetical protein